MKEDTDTMIDVPEGFDARKLSYYYSSILLGQIKN
jgi:hypothetical protein